jgi:anti-sigma factor RsiW
MRCPEVVRLLPLFLDSELSPETNYAVAEHFERCPGCLARVERERRLEEEMRARLTEPAPGDAAAWDEAMRAAARQEASARRRRMRGRVAGWAAAAAAALLLAASLPRTHRELDLAGSAAADHSRFVAEAAEEGLPPATLDQLEAIAGRTFPAARPVPGTLPAGYRLLKVGRCTLDGAPVAYLVLVGGGEPVSLFLMDRGELSRFPGAARRLAEDPAGVSCEVKGRAFFLAGAPDRLACGVGKLEAAELERLVLWLLSG